MTDLALALYPDAGKTERGLDAFDSACFELALELDNLPPCDTLFKLRDSQGRPLASDPFGTQVTRDAILRTRGFRMLYARALELGREVRLQCNATLDLALRSSWSLNISSLRSG